MATYNQARYLRAAVDSILEQSYSNLQAIVVDDGSTDETPEILAEYDDPRLEIIRFRSNQGICAAYNAGFERVRGTYCTWTSSDNVMHVNQVAYLLDLLRGEEDSDLVYSDFEFFGARHGKAGWGDVSFEDIRDQGKTIGASFLFRSDLLRRSGSPPFDARVSGVQDTLMWLDFQLQTKFFHTPEVLYSYRSHDGQLTKDILRSTGYAPLLTRMRSVFDGKYQSWPGQLRVLHVYCYCSHGGVEAVLRNLIPALARRDIASEVCFVQDMGARQSFETLCPTHVVGSTERFMLVPRLREIIECGHFDAIHEVLTPELYEAAREAGFNGPIISGGHGNVELWMQSVDQAPDALVAVSEHVVDQACRMGMQHRRDVRVIPNPVPVARYELAEPSKRFVPPPGKRIIAWVGRITQQKNWRLFVDIAHTLRQQRDDVCFWLVGRHRWLRRSLFATQCAFGASVRTCSICEPYPIPTCPNSTPLYGKAGACLPSHLQKKPSAWSRPRRWRPVSRS